jgi:hypothetical protein
MNLRKKAAGEPCLIRVPDFCRRDDAYTVLAHVRMIGISGMGMKAPDVLAALGCDRCHDVCDGRDWTFLCALTPDQRRLLLLEGVTRTIARRIEQGYIVVKGEHEPRRPKLTKILPRRLS